MNEQCSFRRKLVDSWRLIYAGFNLAVAAGSLVWLIILGIDLGLFATWLFVAQWFIGRAAINYVIYKAGNTNGLDLQRRIGQMFLVRMVLMLLALVLFASIREWTVAVVAACLMIADAVLSVVIFKAKTQPNPQ